MRYLIFTILVFLNACASVQSPQGGPKDAEKPILLKSNLKNGQTEFPEKSIVLEFSENVLENNAKQPFLSPQTGVSVSPQGKKMKITPDSGWRQNQTYQLSLNKKIKDEREGNTASDTSFIFSTGKNIEKGRLEITTENLNGKTPPGKSTLVLTDSGKTRYCRTGEGQIQLGGLKKGNYHIQVFQDKNENLQYEEEDGKLFSDSIHLDSSLNLICRPLPQMYKQIKFFHLRKMDTLILESSRFIRPDSALLKFCVGKNEENTLFCLFPLHNNVMFHHEDSLGNKFTDTIEIARIDSNRSLPAIPLKKKGKTEKKGKQIQTELIWNWLVSTYPDSISYSTDSVWKKTDWEKTKNGIRLTFPMMKPGKIRLRFDSLLFSNKQSLKKDSILLQASDLESPGKITGQIESALPDLKTELIARNREKVAETDQKNFSWQVQPGEYRIQVFQDLNRDGRYTGGNKLLNRKAEPLYVFPDKIELKPGWDLENIRIKPSY